MRANIVEILDRLWQESEHFGEFYKKSQGIGTPLERADYTTNKCVIGCCGKCGGVCSIAKKMERYKRLKKAS